jgi:hypothetical protein
MSVDETSPPSLSSDEEAEVRREVRAKLKAETERVAFEQPATRPSPDASSESRRAERSRVMREEEDAFYAERGLIRYRNHRGETEWLSSDEIARKRLQKHQSRHRGSLLRKMTRRLSFKGVFGFFSVVALFAVGYFLLRPSKLSVFAPAFAVEVLSIPAGAAVFVDGISANSTTDAHVSISSSGGHVISVAKPGYRSVPDAIHVNFTSENAKAVASFSLYPAVPETNLTNGKTR